VSAEQRGLRSGAVTLCLGHAVVDLVCERPLDDVALADAFAPRFGGAVANVAVVAAMRVRGLALELDRPVVFAPNLRLHRWRSRAEAAAAANACVPGALLARLATSGFYPAAAAASLPEAVVKSSLACERWGTLE
jgi:sugar/nucleoside kinase (ribokinase family)